MGHIKEPEGVDFEINSRELTKEEESAISEFIKSYKARRSKEHSAKRRIPKRTTSKQKNVVQER